MLLHHWFKPTQGRVYVEEVNDPVIAQGAVHQGHGCHFCIASDVTASWCIVIGGAQVGAISIAPGKAFK